MGRAVLTLQVPKGVRAIPVATTADLGALRAFKHAVLEEWEAKLETSGDELEATVCRFELERLRHVLELLIPEVTWGGK
jgi:hypothetical protein